MTWWDVATQDALIKIVGLALSIGSVYIAWSRHRKDEIKHRESELRKDEVYAWSVNVIEIMQELSLLTSIGDDCIGEDETSKRISGIIFSTSIAIEKGRLLYKNEKATEYGSHKPEGYRGFRPVILDTILTSHLIARQWASAESHVRVRLSILAYEAEREFVSLAQKETGRGISVSPDGARAGTSVKLGQLLTAIPTSRVDAVLEYRKRALG